MPPTPKTLHSYGMLAAAALALLTVAGGASAFTPQEMSAALRKYGFEYREGERPYGLPIKGKLTRVNIGDETYELDLASPLTRRGVDSAIRDYLLRHAADELHVIGMLAGGPMGNIEVDPDKTLVEELHTDLIQLPFESWRARLQSFKHEGVTIEAHCDFHFVKLNGKYYQLYFKDRGSYKTSEEPGCDVRRSDYHHTN
ncbi:hypothetical protein [Pseudoduganella plicata]|uniref:Uncharacterized protein n=2 Tax=Pseudoduganella plicata TaxID=321984 RepID=A0A4P7BB04_9BURK|nr:hypothetical protein E1742_05230 [Pseudoduganella plicata]GGY96419.1 hypothetical protein GCM10007388_32370 [Pseudoduganella plicata]